MYYVFDFAGAEVAAQRRDGAEVQRLSQPSAILR